MRGSRSRRKRELLGIVARLAGRILCAPCSINLKEKNCAREIGRRSRKRKVLEGGEEPTAGGQAPRNEGPVFRRSQVLGREYRHAINDLPRPSNWDSM